MKVPDCPFCGSSAVESTPFAGPGAPFHCSGCDKGFSTGDLR